MGPGDGAIHAQGPVDFSSYIGVRLSPREQPLPSSVLPPVITAVVAGLPGTVALRHVAPGSTSPKPPEDAVDDRAMVSPLSAASSVARQKRSMRSHTSSVS